MPGQESTLILSPFLRKRSTRPSLFFNRAVFSRYLTQAYWKMFVLAYALIAILIQN